MITINHTVADVRNWFVKLKNRQEYVVDKTGCKMIEVVGATFLADQETIFGEVNHDYVEREIAWYKSMSRNVKDIPGQTPKAWLSCASKDGFINSNYGWIIWSDENYKQYDHVLNELKNNSESRRAVMIYTRPNIWNEYNLNGMSDFICTNTVQYFIRNNKLLALVQMRSNDLHWGYRNDVAFQKYVQNKLASDLDVETGDMIWHAGSLHMYERSFYMIDHFIKTGDPTITKKEYDAIYSIKNDFL